MKVWLFYKSEILIAINIIVNNNDYDAQRADKGRGMSL